MGQRDDRILLSMQWVALVVVLVLLPALVILWGMPGETADLWAWTIKPDLTPIFMGAGYGAGAYFFARVSWGKHWHAGAVGVLGAAVFTAQVGVGFMMLSRDERWSSWRLLVQTFLIAVTLLLVGAARAWDAFDSDNWMTYAYVIGLGMGAVSLAALYVAMERSGSSRA
jgi:hypothetical protein